MMWVIHFRHDHTHVRRTLPRDQTVGTLLTRAYASGGCVLGAIFGTGTNGAYAEDITEITKLGNSITGAGGFMIVNTEWGAFNNSVRTRFPSVAPIPQSCGPAIGLAEHTLR